MPLTSRTLESYTGVRADVIELVPSSARSVLDVGCSNGALGEQLKRQRDAEVWGIELNAELAGQAADRLDRVIEGDALEIEALDRSFDAIVCADVLEHLVEPQRVLLAARRMLEPGGAVIVSLPNVRFYTTFTNLVFRGRWPQRDRGVHDRTHLRWFTDRDARDLFDRAGFRVASSRSHYRLFDRPDRRLNAVARYLAVWPLRGFLAYQHLYVLQ